MTQSKTKLRTQLTDVHLEDQLRLQITMLEPNIELLVKIKQYKKAIKVTFLNQACQSPKNLSLLCTTIICLL